MLRGLPQEKGKKPELLDTNPFDFMFSVLSQAHPFSSDCLILMPSSSSKLDWCVVRLGDDLNWWLTEVSDPLHWDVDGLGIIDPRQMSYILELCEALREYGFDTDIVDDAFFSFTIERELQDGRVRLIRSRDTLLDDNSALFALPDVVDEEKGPYADFLDQITRFRVKLLNDLIEFDQSLTVDEMEDDLRERHNQDYLEGRALHPFLEITNILEFVPAGYELEDEEPDKGEEEDLDGIPDFEEDDEKLEEDETMRWDEDEDADDDLDDDEEEGDGDEEDDEDADSDEESDEDEEEEDEKPRRGRKR